MPLGSNHDKLGNQSRVKKAKLRRRPRLFLKTTPTKTPPDTSGIPWIRKRSSQI